MNSDLPPVGVLLLGSTTPGAIADLARLVEERQFAELWLSEDYFLLAGFSSAAIALAATRRIAVGIGIVAAVARHPAVTAMEIATIAGAYPGRLRVGIGHGVPAWTKQMGLYPKSPLTALREAVTSVRRLLAGETLTQRGHFEFNDIKLHHTARDVPLYTGVTGPKSLALSAEIADGTVISAFAGPKYVATVRALMADRAHALPTYAIYCVDKDRARARRVARSVVASYLTAMGPTMLTGVYDVNDALAAMIEAGGAAAVEAQMPEEWLDWLVVAGPPDECAERIDALLAAGASSVVLTPVPTDELHAQIDLTAAEVLPRLKHSRNAGARS